MNLQIPDSFGSIQITLFEKPGFQNVTKFREFTHNQRLKDNTKTSKRVSTLRVARKIRFHPRIIFGTCIFHISIILPFLKTHIK